MQRIEIKKKIYISPTILAAITQKFDISISDAKKWIQKEIVKEIKNEILYADGIPHSNKEASQRFVVEMFGLCGIEKSEAIDFFNTNFIYGSSTIASAKDIRFAQTIWEAGMDIGERMLSDLSKEDRNDLLSFFK